MGFIVHKPLPEAQILPGNPRIGATRRAHGSRQTHPSPRALPPLATVDMQPFGCLLFKQLIGCVFSRPPHKRVKGARHG